MNTTRLTKEQAMAWASNARMSLQSLIRDGKDDSYEAGVATGQLMVLEEHFGSLYQPERFYTDGSPVMAGDVLLIDGELFWTSEVNGYGLAHRMKDGLTWAIRKYGTTYEKLTPEQIEEHKRKIYEERCQH